MATNYPTSLDTTTELPNRSGSDEQDDAPAHSLITTNVNQAVLALEAKVGVTSSAVTTSHDYRIAQLEGTGALTMVEGDAINLVESGSNLTIASIPQVIRFNLSSGASIAASAADWPNSQRRTKVDLTNATYARIVARSSSPAPASGSFAFRYSTDDSTFAYLDGASGPVVTPTAVNTTYVSSWVALTGAAKADVYIQLVGLSGDGVTSYTMGTIELQVK
jgi:hypothetical protein